MLLPEINLHLVTWDQISTGGKRNFSLKNSILLVFLPLEMQKTDQSIQHVFSLCLKRSDSETFKSSSWKKSFLQCEYYWYNLLWWMFLIPHYNWETLFFTQVYSLIVCFLTAMLLISLKHVFWKISVFYVLSKQKQYDDNTKVS